MHNSFVDFARLKGIHLMNDDIKFIKSCLNKISYSARRRVLEEYSEIWLKGMRETDNVALRDNAGRRKANLFLLELMR